MLLQESFAVNGGDQVSSNLRSAPADLPPGKGGLAPAQIGSPGEFTAPRRLGDLWPLLLALALALLTVEWWLGLLGPAPPRAEPARVQPLHGRTGSIELTRRTRP